MNKDSEITIDHSKHKKLRETARSAWDIYGSAIRENRFSIGGGLSENFTDKAIEKSSIESVIKLIVNSYENTKYKMIAIVAPSISSQFTHAKLGQVITAIKKLGFYIVTEAALGADMVAHKEAKELYEKKYLFSSCCPAFVQFVKKQFPQLADNVSVNLSPMATIAKYLKSKNPNDKIVFIGPCTAKKVEIKDEKVKPYVDEAITFIELSALFDSKEIDISVLEETSLDYASYFGRVFARCGGISEAVQQGLNERNLNFKLKSISCSGLEECRDTLLKFSKGLLDVNFIEGMACRGGCIGGNCCLTHAENDAEKVNEYGKLAKDKTITQAITALPDYNPDE